MFPDFLCLFMLLRKFVNFPLPARELACLLSWMFVGGLMEIEVISVFLYALLLKISAD